MEKIMIIVMVNITGFVWTVASLYFGDMLAKKTYGDDANIFIRIIVSVPVFLSPYFALNLANFI